MIAVVVRICPVKKRSNDSRVPISKSIWNFGAKVGQVIQGNLIRGAGGKFANSRELATLKKKIAMMIMRRLRDKAKKEAEKAKKQAQRRAETAARRAAAKKSKAASRKKSKDAAKKEHDKEKKKEREKVFADLIKEIGGELTIDDLHALQDARDGLEIDPAIALRLAKAGLIEFGEDGSVLLSSRSKGRALLNAANRSDLGEALEQIEIAKNNMIKIKDRIKDKEDSIKEVRNGIARIGKDLEIDQAEFDLLNKKLAGEKDSIKKEALQIRINRLANKMQDSREGIQKEIDRAAKMINDVDDLKQKHGLDNRKLSSSLGKIPTRPNPTIKSDEPIDKSNHDSQSVLILIDGILRSRAIAMAEMINADDLSAWGREYNPHITVKYGFPAWITIEDIQRAAGLFQPFKVRFGHISLFEQDEFDVVKVEVESQELRRLNRLISFLPNQDSHIEYNPHLTLAYVLPGEGKKYFLIRNELLNTEYEVNEISFSDFDDHQTTIRLGVQKSVVDAPGYRLSDDRQVRCNNCLFNVRGTCELYDFKFDQGFMCDNWISEIQIVKVK